MERSSFIILRPRGSGFFTKEEDATYLPSKDMESAFAPPKHLTKAPNRDPTKELRSEIEDYCSSIRCTCLKAVRKSAPCRTERLFVCKASLIKTIDKETPSQTWTPELLFTLLCDREILCSHNHQDYLQNYKSYADVRKVLAGMTKRLKGEASDANYYAIIRQCAVSGISDERLRDRYKQMLDFFHDAATARSVQHKAGSLSEALEELRFYLEYSSYDRSVLYAESRVTQAEASDAETQTPYLSAIKSVFSESRYPFDAFFLDALREEDAEIFVTEIVPRYMKLLNMYNGYRDASAHFQRGYRAWEYVQFEEDKSLSEQMNALWRAALSETTAMSPGNIASWLLCGENQLDFSSTGACDIRGHNSDSLYNAATDYLKELRGSDAAITSSDFEILLRNQSVCKQPFWLICILAMPRFTEVLKDGLSCEQLEAMLSTLGYNSTCKSDIRLRIKGMRLLKEAITVLDVCNAQCKKSWELFIAVFGNRVSSSEEAALWHKILDTNGNMRPNSFPLIRLQLLISGSINSCLPTQPERLYSYQSASPLHTRGGYAEFLKDHPSAVDEIAKRIKQHRAKWKAELSQYQRAWSTDALIIADAAKLCYISSSKLEWGTLCREYGIANFCKQYVNKHTSQESIQAELKALLTEHAMRQVLNDDARDILKRAAKALFNTKFGFDVQFLQG